MTVIASALDPGFATTGAVGVYVHVPFCLRRCPYCNFDIAVRRQIPHERYRDALLTELDARALAWTGDVTALRTLYFGGGTPALLRADCLVDVVAGVCQVFDTPVASLLEVTLEANPEDLDRSALRRLREGGVTRLSLGVQSFDAETLAFLGRHHDPDQARSAIVDAQALGFELNVDLIFGASVQTRARLESDLQTVADLGVEHVSAYGLTIEPATPFGRRDARGEALTVDEDESADRYERVASRLAELAGFVRYEVSNLARDHAWARHNSLYWLGGQYLGLGMGAHSLRRDARGAATRRANGPDLRAWLADPAGHVAFEEHLDAATHLAERLFMALRTRFELDLGALTAEHPDASLSDFEPALRSLERDGLVTRSGDHIAATERGLALHDTLAERIMSGVR